MERVVYVVHVCVRVCVCVCVCVCLCVCVREREREEVRLFLDNLYLMDKLTKFSKRFHYGLVNFSLKELLTSFFCTKIKMATVNFYNR